MSHFIEYCTYCKRVIAQCRCISAEKEQRYGVCKDCKRRRNERLDTNEYVARSLCNADVSFAVNSGGIHPDD